MEEYYTAGELAANRAIRRAAVYTVALFIPMLQSVKRCCNSH